MGNVTVLSVLDSKAFILFQADSIALHEEFENAEANKSLGQTVSEPKILSHGREKPVLYLFRNWLDEAVVAPESDSDSSTLALLR